MWKFWIVMIYKLDPSAMNGCYPTIYGWLPDDAVYKGQGGTVFINETDARRAYETTQINDEVCRVELLKMTECQKPVYVAKKGELP